MDRRSRGRRPPDSVLRSLCRVDSPALHAAASQSPTNPLRSGDRRSRDWALANINFRPGPAPGAADRDNRTAGKRKLVVVEKARSQGIGIKALHRGLALIAG